MPQVPPTFHPGRLTPPYSPSPASSPSASPLPVPARGWMPSAYIYMYRCERTSCSSRAVLAM
jgi:hypothetical protein